jgi:CheY-like chemotaxis protein
MKEIIDILLLEDSIDDVELILMILDRAALANHCTVVSGKQEFLNAIEKSSFDLVISDLNLGQFNCFDAMDLYNNPRPPFIVVSGMINPESMNRLRQRNISYLFKDDLKKLPEMIIKVLAQK